MELLRAQASLKDGIQSENACLSTQVLGEFFVVVTQRIKKPLKVEEAQEIIKILSPLPVQEIDLALVNRAIETHHRYLISYWDSLILAAAERANCGSVLSEDLNDGQEYNGILVVNPFK